MLYLERFFVVAYIDSFASVLAEGKGMYLARIYPMEVYYSWCSLESSKMAFKPSLIQASIFPPSLIGSFSFFINKMGVLFRKTRCFEFL